MPSFDTPDRVSKPCQGLSELPFISVIIPVRNEAQNIINLLLDLENQTYPKDKFEVIIADDSSTDNTVLMVKEFAQKSTFNLIINELKDIKRNTSPKKRAINSSIQIARGELITTTDGDCRVKPQWLETIGKFYAEKQPFLISSFVTFFDKSRLSDSVQIIEFASLVGSGACAMAIQKPNMCNGANISYRKDVFFEVGGFSGNENVASGDDEFLMHKIAAKYPDKVQFLKSQNSIVETYAHNSFRSFYLQRKRWASKWKHYQNKSVSALAVFVFLANFSVILVDGWYFFGDLSLRLFLTFIALKFSAEFVFLSLILRFLNKKSLIGIIPIVQIIYPFYVSFFGLIAQGEGYEWKGRKLK